MLFVAILYNGGRRRQKLLRRLVRFMSFCLFCSVMFTMALWLENGMFHGSLVGLVLYVWSFLRSIMEVIELVFGSASSIVETRLSVKQYRKLTTRVAALFELSLLALIIALLVLCKTPSYNLVLCIAMLIIGGFNIILIFFMLREIRRLQFFAKRECTRLPSGNEVLLEKWKDFSWRMRILTLAVNIYFFIYVVGILALPLIHFILGSSPFTWVFLCASMHVVLLSLSCIYFFLRQPMNSARHSFFAVGENMDSEEVTAYRGMFGMRTPIFKGKIRLSMGRLMLSSRAPTAPETNVETYDSANYAT